MILIQLQDALRHITMKYRPIPGTDHVDIEELTISAGYDAREKLQNIFLKLLKLRNEEWFHVKLTEQMRQYESVFQDLGFGFLVGEGRAHRSMIAYSLIKYANA